MKHLPLLLLLMFALNSCLKKVNIGAVVMEKGYGYNRAANRFEYHTIVKTDDGYIEDIEGIGTYYLPIGSRCTVEVYREQSKN